MGRSSTGVEWRGGEDHLRSAGVQASWCGAWRRTSCASPTCRPSSMAWQAALARSPTCRSNGPSRSWWRSSTLTSTSSLTSFWGASTLVSTLATTPPSRYNSPSHLLKAANSCKHSKTIELSEKPAPRESFRKLTARLILKQR